MSVDLANSATAELLAHYQDRSAVATLAHRAGTAVAGMTSNTVPRELIAAAGVSPVLVSPSAVNRPGDAATLPHRRYMEESFETRWREIFDALVLGEWSWLRSLIIPRTSEAEHKLFLYLREMQRQSRPPLPADVYLYNLLHTRSDAARQYSWERTLALKQHLEELSGQEATADRLADAIADGNAARQAARRLQEARRRGWLGGREGFALLGARYFMAPRDYARLATEIAAEIESRPALVGPRVMIKGHGLDHPGLHSEIESHGAIVVAEDDWRGARGVTADIDTQSDPLQAVFEHYYQRETSPRCFPLDIADEWFNETARTVHGVVFYLPPDDDVIGWDYPRHCRRLDEQGVPHLLIRCDATDLHANAPVRDDIAAFVNRLKEGH